MRSELRGERGVSEREIERGRAKGRERGAGEEDMVDKERGRRRREERVAALMQ